MTTCYRAPYCYIRSHKHCSKSCIIKNCSGNCTKKYTTIATNNLVDTTTTTTIKLKENKELCNEYYHKIGIVTSSLIFIQQHYKIPSIFRQYILHIPYESCLWINKTFVQSDKHNVKDLRQLILLSQYHPHATKVIFIMVFSEIIPFTMNLAEKAPLIKMKHDILIKYDEALNCSNKEFATFFKKRFFKDMLKIIIKTHIISINYI